MHLDSQLFNHVETQTGKEHVKKQKGTDGISGEHIQQVHDPVGHDNQH